MSELIRANFDSVPGSFRRLQDDEFTQRNTAHAGRKEDNMTREIKLVRGTPHSLHQCPVCKGSYDVDTSGFGWTTCPNCDSRLHFGTDGSVAVGEVIAASRADGLTPKERMFSRRFGLTPEEMIRQRE